MFARNEKGACSVSANSCKQPHTSNHKRTQSKKIAENAHGVKHSPANRTSRPRDRVLMARARLQRPRQTHESAKPREKPGLCSPRRVKGVAQSASVPLISRQAAIYILKEHCSSAFVLCDDSEGARGTLSETSSTQRESYTMSAVTRTYFLVARRDYVSWRCHTESGVLRAYCISRESRSTYRVHCRRPKGGLALAVDVPLHVHDIQDGKAPTDYTSVRRVEVLGVTC